MMDCIWCYCKPNGRLAILSTIVLGEQSEGGEVTFRDNCKANGKKHYLETTMGNFMLIEFAAAKRGTWKRHILRQVDNSIFKLIDEEDPLNAMYMQTKWWSPWSEIHDNKVPVYLQQFKVP